MSHYFEDFVIDSVVKTRGRTITEADVVNFACLTGDFVELHINEEYARKGPFGRRIAHGACVFSFAIGLLTQLNLVHDSVIAFYGVDRLRFTAPVFIGDTIHVTQRVIDKQEKEKDRGVISLETLVFNQHGKTVLAYTEKLMVKKRG